MVLVELLDNPDCKAGNDVVELTVSSIQIILEDIKSLISNPEATEIKQKIVDCAELNTNIITDVLSVKNNFLNLSTEKQRDIILQRRSLEFIEDEETIELVQSIEKLSITKRNLSDLENHTKAQNTIVDLEKDNVRKSEELCQKLQTDKDLLCKVSAAAGAAGAIALASTGPIGWLVGGVGLGLNYLNTKRMEESLQKCGKEAEDQKNELENQLKTALSNLEESKDKFSTEENFHSFVETEVEVSSFSFSLLIFVARLSTLPSSARTKESVKYWR